MKVYRRRLTVSILIILIVGGCWSLLMGVTVPNLVGAAIATLGGVALGGVLMMWLSNWYIRKW